MKFYPKKMKFYPNIFVSLKRMKFYPKKMKFYPNIFVYLKKMKFYPKMKFRNLSCLIISKRCVSKVDISKVDIIHNLSWEFL